MWNWDQVQKENEMLQRLQESPELQQKLTVCKPEDLRVGLYLFYSLSGSYGCHCIRADGYRKDAEGSPVNDMLGACKAGLFYRFSN